jgi:hypothetical protein
MTQMKDAIQRRRYNQPAKGEWVDLPEVGSFKPVLPAYKPEWNEWIDARTKDGDTIEVRRGVERRMWNGWRRDPVTTQYGQADIEAIIYLAQAFHTLSDASRFAMMDRLGLTPKGRRDLRWRLPVETKSAQEANEKAAQVRRVRAISERKAA